MAAGRSLVRQLVKSPQLAHLPACLLSAFVLWAADFFFLRRQQLDSWLAHSFAHLAATAAANNK